MTKYSTLERYLYVLERPPRESEPRQKHPTTLRLIALVADGKVCNQVSAARVLGITHQRVQQIVKAEGLVLNGHQPNTLLSWPCPSCGNSVEIWSVTRNNKETAYCPPCARHFSNLGRVGPRRRCAALGCERPYRGRGWCVTHLARWQRGQDTAAPIRRERRAKGCTELECLEYHYAKGLCRSHYNKARTAAKWSARAELLRQGGGDA